MTSWAQEALADAAPRTFWSDRDDAPEPASPLVGTATTDLVVCGGGFTGLWTAIQAMEEQPGRRVTILEAATIGFGASTRNGGMLDRSLTHGTMNGVAHWPDEMETLVRMGRENFEAITDTIRRHGIDADHRCVAALGVATAPWQLDEMSAAAGIERSFGDDVKMIDAADVRRHLDSPTYVGGTIRSDHNATVDPARLVWGLLDVAVRLGAVIHEHSPVVDIVEVGPSVVVSTPNGTVSTERVVVATNAYRPPVRRIRRYVIPVYDHVLVTEPLTADRMASIGWEGREGVDDGASQFHYYRLTADDRILWGGYDATYHFNNDTDPANDQSDQTHTKLAGHFFDTFPQLEGLRFTHRWGGPIGTTSRFTCAWGTSHRGRTSWVAGYTGLGVGASRFGARVALDLVDGRSTERTELAMVRTNPFPFPPEPFRSAAVAVTKRAIQRSDDRDGRPGAWLKLLDRFGIGFDS